MKTSLLLLLTSGPLGTQRGTRAQRGKGWWGEQWSNTTKNPNSISCVFEESNMQYVDLEALVWVRQLQPWNRFALTRIKPVLFSKQFCHSNVSALVKNHVKISINTFRKSVRLQQHLKFFKSYDFPILLFYKSSSSGPVFSRWSANCSRPTVLVVEYYSVFRNHGGNCPFSTGSWRPQGSKGGRRWTWWEGTGGVFIHFLFNVKCRLNVCS